ncbi:hypothetical protein PAPHI01_0902 [Pancytospora philotis]|nr:hypothetical protein PAPHI01_0902 [Pancytospora philotis]
MYQKLLRFAAAETFLQLGFEKTSEHALNIAADLLAHYIEAQTKRILPFQGGAAAAPVKMLVADFYRLEEYQKEELFQFLDQQMQIRRQTKEKAEDGMLQHALNAMPQEARDAFRTNAFKMAGAVHPEEKSRHKVVHEISVDGFLAEFIGKCSAKEPEQRAAPAPVDGTGILSDCYQIVPAPAAPKEGATPRPPSVFKPAQTLFSEDYAGSEIYKISGP